MVSRRRYDGLDGLRGVAALAVVLFHVGRWINEPWFPHGYLAVDFFFCLSGFVMAHAYEPRLASGMGMAAFAHRRWVRLWPLIALSMALGAMFGVAKAVLNLPGADNLAGVASATILGLLLVPMFWGAHESYLDRVFPLNGPAWSLFFEVFANLVWASVARWLSTRLLICVAALSGALLLLGGLKLGHLDFGAHTATFWLGFPRVFFSFTLGLLIYRLHSSQRSRLKSPIWIAAIPLLLALSAPVHPWQVVFEAVAVAVIFPLIVLASAAQPEAEGAAGAAWRFSGDISYPLYALHAPLWFLLTRALETINVGLSPSLGLLFPIIAIGASWVALKMYDEPLRARLALRPRRGPALQS